MLTYTIERYQPPAQSSKASKKDKPKVVVGSEEHKKFIYFNHLHHAVNSAWISEGKYVRIRKRKGTGAVACIIGIETDPSKIEWDGLKCKFVEVYVPSTEECLLYHYSDLARMR